MRRSAKVEIFGCDDSYWVINGPGATERTLLSADMKGIYAAPVTTRYRSSAYQKGSTYGGKKVKQRDLTFAVDIKGDNPEDWEALDSAWQAAWDFELDPWDPDAHLTKMSITTDSSGTRSLWLAKTESVAFESKNDPHLTGTSKVPMTATAAQPFWFEDKYEDTPYDYFETGSSGTSNGFVTIANPTDQPMYLKWVVTQGTWTLPDFSWTGKKYNRAPGGQWANRLITLPALGPTNGGARINIDPMEIMIRDFTGTNLIALMNSIYFMHPIPPYTKPVDVPVKVDGAPTGGARVEVYCPRRWNSCWGGF